MLAGGYSSPSAISQPLCCASTPARSSASSSGRITETQLPSSRVRRVSPLWSVRYSVTPQERISRRASSLVMLSGTEGACSFPPSGGVSAFPPQPPSANIVTEAAMTAGRLTFLAGMYAPLVCSRRHRLSGPGRVAGRRRRVKLLAKGATVTLQDACGRWARPRSYPRGFRGWA